MLRRLLLVPHPCLGLILPPTPESALPASCYLAPVVAGPQPPWGAEPNAGCYGPSAGAAYTLGAVKVLYGMLVTP